MDRFSQEVREALRRGLDDVPESSASPGGLQSHLAALRTYFGGTVDAGQIEDLILETFLRCLASPQRPQQLEEVRPFLMEIAAEVLAERNDGTQA